MFVELLKGKVHRATVTDADLEYVGSLTLDENLAKAAGFLPHERISVWNITNGARLDTYVIYGPPGKGDCVINGAAARHMHKGDLVIICAWCNMDNEEAKSHQPDIVFVNEKNQIVELKKYEEPMVKQPA